LHQAIEAKEGVTVQQESKTLASITLQNYFRMYDKLAGMTGTAVTSAEEFHKVYDLDVVIMPTNREIKRIDLADVVYKNEKAKFKAIAQKVKELSQKGQPVLLGTASIEKSEALGQVFDKFGLKYTILNAKQHEAEGLIIADAGKKGAITIATNMAGRGVDIKLGGANATEDEKQEILDLGGLYVIGSERHEARRIDNQLRGRSGRQGEIGTTQFYLSLDDEIMRIFGGERIKALMERFNFPEDEPIENVLIAKSIEGAQTKIEGFHFDSRKHLLEYDDVLNKQREIVYRKRRDIILNKINLQEQTTDLIKENVYKVVSFYTTSESIRDWDLQAIKEDINGLIGSKLDLGNNLEAIRDKEGTIDIKKEAITDYLVKTIEDILQNRFSTITEEQYQAIMNSVYIQTLDNLWMDHLEIIDYLKTGIRLRGYAQRDPLVEYKNEAFMLFEKLLSSIQTNYINTILRVEPTMNTQLEQPQNMISGEIITRVGRNDACPCGSGKKYKKCHGK
jgi:preprotein translocase subunit SecA